MALGMLIWSFVAIKLDNKKPTKYGIINAAGFRLLICALIWLFAKAYPTTMGLLGSGWGEDIREPQSGVCAARAVLGSRIQDDIESGDGRNVGLDRRRIWAVPATRIRLRRDHRSGQHSAACVRFRFAAGHLADETKRRILAGRDGSEAFGELAAIAWAIGVVQRGSAGPTI